MTTAEVDLGSDLLAPADHILLMIPIEQLDHHPNNVREDYRLTPSFMKSISTEQQVPISVVPIPGDYARKEGEELFKFWVTKGNRRLAGAREGGEVTELECLVDLRRAADVAGQLMDMYTENEQREGLTVSEQAQALFQAYRAGATKKRIAAGTGLNPQEVTAGITAGAKLSQQTRRFAEELDYEWTLPELAKLAPFNDNPAALEKIRDKMRWNSFDHAVSSVHTELEQAAKRARLRDELEQTGICVTDSLPDGALSLVSLSRVTEQELDADTHRTCQGHGAYFLYGDAPSYYCKTPEEHGYIPPQPAQAAQAASSQDPEAARRARRIVKEGRREWKACADVRHEWLKTLLTRATAPKQLLAVLTRLLLSMPEPLRDKLAGAHTSSLWYKLAGSPKADTALVVKPGKLPLLVLAPIAVAFEHQMTLAGEAANTWRSDKWSACSRADAALWLSALQGLGYVPSLLERSLIEDFPYQGEDPDAYAVDGQEPADGADTTTRDSDADDVAETTPVPQEQDLAEVGAHDPEAPVDCTGDKVPSQAPAE
jgi:ParB family chromosome partitioning protein